MKSLKKSQLLKLQQTLEGEIYTRDLYKKIYATDASVYREIPIAVAFPKSEADVVLLIQFAQKHKISVIPRAAGTSLAGQTTGKGLIIDCSRYLNRVIEINTKEKKVVVYGGVVRDELNQLLKPYKLFFGPNTSTSNRCTIAGMIGNNSSGTTSIQYGTTREKLIALKVVLNTGEILRLSAKNFSEFQHLQQAQTCEGKLYRQIVKLLKDSKNQRNIREVYPHPEIHRRNTGYALDVLLSQKPFNEKGEAFNLAKLICGSEGTLAFILEAELALDDLPPTNEAMLAVHFNNVTDALEAVETAMQFNLFMCELMDKTILDCTKGHLTYQASRFFIQGDPGAILLCELRSDSPEDLNKQLQSLQEKLQQKTRAYASPVLYNEAILKAIELRKAGLGLLANLRSNKKAVACIEDTAVRLCDLPAYIKDFTAIMNKYQQRAVYYAHAGAGELHLRPILDLKQKEDIVLFEKITHEVALLVKQYRGSFSGEHGDGRVRSPFLPEILGPEVMYLLQQVKKCFDPDNIFNPHKIIQPKAMTENLRYDIAQAKPAQLHTMFNFGREFLKEVEQCNGSGDCRKGIEAGGVMCPSYRATKNERDTTRARANLLRELLTYPDRKNPLSSRAVKEVLSLCVSCKACKKECPSNVDLATFKSEALFHYFNSNARPLSDYVFAYQHKLLKASKSFNWFIQVSWFQKFLKKGLAIAPERELPLIAKKSLRTMLKNRPKQQNLDHQPTPVYFFIDEFTDLLEPTIGYKAVKLLEYLGYEVIVTNHKASGRALLSKGFLKQAKKLAIFNVNHFTDVMPSNAVLVGIEPSAILSFRDEYIQLHPNRTKAQKLAAKVFLIEEFLAQEINKKNIKANSFTTEKQEIKVHTHCHQKALGQSQDTFKILNLPKNYSVKLMATGCCGMAGSFGYEKQNYATSLKMAEQNLMKKLKNTDNKTLVVANGTSCREQIKHCSPKTAKHPIEVLYSAIL